MKPNFSKKEEDTMIKASIKAGVTKDEIIKTFYENGLIGIYNLGMRHMYNYLKGEIK